MHASRVGRGQKALFDVETRRGATVLASAPHAPRASPHVTAATPSPHVVRGLRWRQYPLAFLATASPPPIPCHATYIPSQCQHPITGEGRPLFSTRAAIVPRPPAAPAPYSASARWCAGNPPCLRWTCGPSAWSSPFFVGGNAQFQNLRLEFIFNDVTVPECPRCPVSNMVWALNLVVRSSYCRLNSTPSNHGIPCVSGTKTLKKKVTSPVLLNLLLHPYFYMYDRLSLSY